MKFNVSGKEFMTQLSAVTKVLNAKNSMPILDNILFILEGETLTMIGADMDNKLTVTMPVSGVEGNGKIAVPAKRLVEVTKEVQSQPLTFIINDDTFEINLKFLTGHFDFMGTNPDEYPTQQIKPDEEPPVTIIVPADVIVDGLDTTLFAVSPETIRPIMTGILWDVHENDITFVSSDTHKLVKYVNQSVSPEIVKNFILPSKPASILKGLLEKQEGAVTVTISAKSVGFKFADFELTSSLINGKYPDYNRVIPTDNPFMLTVERTSLLSAMRRVGIFASKASNLVRMTLDTDSIRLSGQDLDYSTSAEEKIDCEYKGNPMTIGFNSNYMIEVLSNLKDDMVLIRLCDPARPGLFEPLQNKENEQVVMLQMPMQVYE